MSETLSRFRSLRRLVWPALALLALAAGAVWVASFDARSRIEAALSDALGAQVRIRRLAWGGLSRLTVEGVVVANAGQQVARLERLRAVGSPWGALRKRITLDTLEIVAPALTLRREASGLWNLPLLNAPSDTAAPPSDWSLEIRHGSLQTGSATVAVGEARIAVDSLNVDFGVRREGRGHAFLLSRLNTLVLSPPLVIRRMDVNATLREDGLDLTALDLTTGASHLRLSGQVRDFRDPRVDLTLASDRLSSDEVRRFLPSFPEIDSFALTASARGGADGTDIAVDLRTPVGQVTARGRFTGARETYEGAVESRHLNLAGWLPGYETPTDLNLSAEVSGAGLGLDTADLTAALTVRASTFGKAAFDSSTVRLRLKGGTLDADGRVRVGGWGDARLRGRADLTAIPLRFRMDADVEDLNLGPLTGDRRLDSRLSGRAGISGAGWHPDSLDLEGRVTLRPSRLAGRRIDGLEAEVRYQGRVLTLDRLVLRTPAGGGRATGHAEFPAGRPAAYGAEMEVAGLDLAEVTGDTTLRSHLNGKASLAGEGAEEVAIHLEGSPSRLMGVPIHRIAAAGSLRNGAWTIDRLDLESGAGDVRLSGRLGPSDSVDVRADLRFTRLPPALGLNADLSGWVSGTVRGRAGDLRVAAAGQADSLVSGGAVLRGVTFDADLRGLDARRPDAGVKASVSGDLTAHVGSLGVSSLVFRDLIAGAHLTPGAADLAIDIAPTEKTRVNAAGRVAFDAGGLTAQLDTLFVDADRVHIRNDGPCHLRYAYEGTARLDRLRMTQAGGALTASGEVDAGGRLRADVRLEGVDLARWEALLGRKDGLAGVLGLSATASGSLRNPDVSGAVEIENGRVADFTYRRLAGAFGYRAGVGHVDLRLDQDQAAAAGRGLTMKGSFPLPAGPDGAIDVRVLSDGLDLAFLQAAFPDLKDVRGTVRMDLGLTGAVRHPALSGFLEVPSGSLRVPGLGLRLTDIHLRTDVEPGRLRLSDLTLKTRGGTLKATGWAALDGLGVTDFTLDGRAEAFDALDGKDAQLSVGGSLRLAGRPDRPEVAWDLTILRALLPIPEDEGTPPEAPSPLWDSAFVRGMTCHGRLRVPRNAWVRSVDFNTEVRGEIEVTKEGPAFVVFGGLEAIPGRGQYIFQNAGFSIERGELRFRGTPDNDPDLYLLGTRRVARALPDATGRPGQDLLINIVVGGTLNAPKISLESDAPTPLDQADLLSYALFGRPSSQTLIGSIGGAGSTAGFQSQAKNLVAGITANRLKQTVGRELGLDVLEVEVGQGKEPLTHLAVGKYVRRDLLLTFSQDVVEAAGQDRLGRKVSVEYEFGRNFGLSGSVDDQKKTALDLFWKKEW